MDEGPAQGEGHAGKVSWGLEDWGGWDGFPRAVEEGICNCQGIPPQPHASFVAPSEWNFTKVRGVRGPERGGQTATSHRCAALRVQSHGDGRCRPLAHLSTTVASLQFLIDKNGLCGEAVWSAWKSPGRCLSWGAAGGLGKVVPHPLLPAGDREGSAVLPLATRCCPCPSLLPVFEEPSLVPMMVCPENQPLVGQT